MYLVAFLTKKYVRTAQALLAVRWFGHVAAGRPWLAPGLWLTTAVDAVTGAALLAVCEAMTTMAAPATVRRWRDAWAFRRRWPVLWASAQKQRTDDGVPVRPVAVSPRLPLFTADGFYPKVTDVAAMFAVKPARGQTLAQLAQTSQTIAAQLSAISRVEVEFDTASQTTGRLLVTFTDVFETSEAPSWR